MQRKSEIEVRKMTGIKTYGDTGHTKLNIETASHFIHVMPFHRVRSFSE